MISRDVALLNNGVEGAYVQSLVAGSPAEKAGIKPGDIVIDIDNQRIAQGKGDLAKIIAGHKVGDSKEKLRGQHNSRQLGRNLDLLSRKSLTSPKTSEWLCPDKHHH